MLHSFVCFVKAYLLDIYWGLRLRLQEKSRTMLRPSFAICNAAVPLDEM